jgi:hypothetical protein
MRFASSFAALALAMVSLTVLYNDWNRVFVEASKTKTSRHLALCSRPQNPWDRRGSRPPLITRKLPLT